MMDGRQTNDWNHTASIIATIANTARDPKKRRKPFSASEFHPFAKPATTKVGMRYDIKDLRHLFVGHRHAGHGNQSRESIC